MLVGSGALPLWAGKAPPSFAPPTSTVKNGGRGWGGQAAWHSTSANLHTYTCGYCNGVLDEGVAGKCCGGVVCGCGAGPLSC